MITPPSTPGLRLSARDEEHHSFSHSFKMNLLRLCCVPGTILSPREGSTPSLQELAFWQETYSERGNIINADAFQRGCVLYRKNCEVGVGGMALQRVARTGLLEEGAYLDLKVPVWRGFTHWVGLD